MRTSASNSDRGRKMSLTICLPSNNRSWRDEVASPRPKHNSRVSTCSGVWANNSCKDAATSPPTLARLLREPPRRCRVRLQRTTALNEANHHHDHGDDQEKMNV